MSEGWQAGDLAACVDSRRNQHPKCALDDQLVVGRIYRVQGVVPAFGNHSLFGKITLGLRLEGVRSFSATCSFAAQRFRKIRPDEREACEPEFVTLLKRAKRTVTA